MRIEKIKKSNHKQEQILVYLEGGTLIRVTESELLHFGLYVGLDISPQTVIELRAAGETSKTRVRAANIIAARPLSKKELQKRLCEKGASEENAADAAKWLENIGALDDEAYAAALVRHYSTMGYGAARLREELHHRGVPREMWDQALASAPEAAFVIDRVIAQKMKGKLPDEKEKKKLNDMLLRRGFPWREVKAAFARMGTMMEDEEF